MCLALCWVLGDTTENRNPVPAFMELTAGGEAEKASTPRTVSIMVRTDI